jgi:hypothetical protein
MYLVIDCSKWRGRRGDILGGPAFLFASCYCSNTLRFNPSERACIETISATCSNSDTPLRSQFFFVDDQPHNNEICALAGLGVSAEHFLLKLVREGSQVSRKSVEQRPFRLVRSEFASQFAFGSVSAKLFELFLTILHDRPCALFQRTRVGRKPFLIPGGRFNRVPYFPVGIADRHGPPGVFRHAPCQYHCFFGISEIEGDH